MWQEMQVRLDFTTPLCGGVPMDGSKIEAWLRARAPKKAPAMPEKTIPDIQQEVLATLPEEQEESLEFSHTGFQRDDTGLFIRGANLRAHLKECAMVLGQQMKAGAKLPCRSVQNFRDKVIRRLYVAEERMYILNPETLVPLREPTGHRDSTPSVFTPRGPRTCLKRTDYCHPAALLATLKFLPEGNIGPEHIEPLFQYGMVQGFNQDRSLQFGQYNYTFL